MKIGFLVVLLLVLGLVVLRLQDLQNVLLRPKAAGRETGANSKCASDCFNDTGNGSGCAAYCLGTGPYPSGGSKSSDPGKGLVAGRTIQVQVKNGDCTAATTEVTVRMMGLSACSGACNSGCADSVCQAREKQTVGGVATWQAPSGGSYTFGVTGQSDFGTCVIGANDTSCVLAPRGANCSPTTTPPPVPAPTPGTEVSSCFGNGGNNGKCYDFNGDGEINIMDFAVWRNFWQQSVGT